jgi:hypothetical protein
MKRRSALSLVLAAFALALVPVPAAADPNNESATFQLHIEVPNVAEAPNGDQVTVTGMGVFSVHPKSVTASGTFTHRTSSGTIVGTGAWTATELLSFEFYGCGVIVSTGTLLPPNFCGGALKMAVTLTPAGTTLAISGILTIFCIVGPQAPTSHDDPTEEGVSLVVPGIANFNKQPPVHTNMNIYIRTA